MNTLEFDRKEFIKTAIESFKLKDANLEKIARLEAAIDQRLSERIVATFVRFMTQKDVEKLERLTQENPKADTFDLLKEIAKDIPGIDEKLEKGINDLLYELTYDVNQIHEYQYYNQQ